MDSFLIAAAVLLHRHSVPHSRSYRRYIPGWAGFQGRAAWQAWVDVLTFRPGMGWDRFTNVYGTISLFSSFFSYQYSSITPHTTPTQNIMVSPGSLGMSRHTSCCLPIPTPMAVRNHLPHIELHSTQLDVPPIHTTSDDPPSTSRPRRLCPPTLLLPFSLSPTVPVQSKPSPESRVPLTPHSPTRSPTSPSPLSAARRLSSPSTRCPVSCTSARSLARPSRSRAPGSRGACTCEWTVTELPSGARSRGCGRLLREVWQASCEGEVREMVMRE
jgi:hypothetical protein